MKKSISRRLVPVLFAGMFMYAGCAKQEVIKKDESIAPVASKTMEATPSRPDSSVTTTQGKSIASTGMNSSLSGTVEQKQRTDVSTLTAGMQETLEKIYFDFDSSSLRDAERITLSRDFDVLKKRPISKIRIEGHCDERGSDEYNLALGERRAQVAFHYLNTLGIPADRMTTISYGKEKPADPGHNEASWARNRRDEIVISK